MLDVERLVLHRDGLFHRDDVHAHAAAARRQQMRLARQRHVGHALKELGKLRMLLQPGVPARKLRILLHVEQLRAARYEHRQDIPPLRGRRSAPVVVIVVAVVVFQKADVAHLVEQLLEMRLLLLRDLVHLPELFDGVGRAELHGQGDVGHLVGHDAGQPPVFRVLRAHLAELVVDDVRDLFAKLQNFLPRRSLALGGGGQRALLQFLIDHAFVSFFFSLCVRIRVQSQSASASTPSPVLRKWGRSQDRGCAAAQTR